MNHRKITSLTLDEPIGRYIRHHESLIARQPFQKPIMNSLIADQIQEKRVTPHFRMKRYLQQRVTAGCNLVFCQFC